MKEGAEEWRDQEMKDGGIEGWRRSGEWWNRG